MTATADRLPRLLALVPWLLAHPNTPVGDVAREFGVSEQQIRKDLDLIFVCGLPGHTPGDLMEVGYVGDRVTVRNADTLARPLRLSAEEALALIVALRTMVPIPAINDAAVRALAKLQTAVGAAAEAAGRVAVVVDSDPAVVAAVGTALDQGKRLRLEYYVPGRDETTRREVDPMRLAWAGGRPYLEGYCRRAEDVRLFRLDRVLDLEVLDVPAEVPADVEPRDLSEGLYRPAPEHVVVELALAPEARWVADYYPCESVAETAGGGLTVRLRTPDTGWLVRLALRLGPAARVVRPPDVAAAVRSAAAEALASYAE